MYARGSAGKNKGCVCVCVCGGGGGHDKFRTVRGGIMRKFNLVPRALFPGFGVGPLGLGWRKLAYKSGGCMILHFCFIFKEMRLLLSAVLNST